MDIRRADMIAETLEQHVFAGKYRDGERLDELKLADQFCVSRTPVREALQVLVANGIAEQFPRRGVFVRLPGPVELMEMFEMMAELEASCGRLAASRMTETGLRQLAEANIRCQEAIDQNDHAKYYAENEKFHQIIYRGSANGYLEQQTLRLQNKLKAYRRMQLRFRGRMAQSMAEHREIVAALEAEDAEKVASVLRNHVAVQGEKFHQLMANFNS